MGNSRLPGVSPAFRRAFAGLFVAVVIGVGVLAGVVVANGLGDRPDVARASPTVPPLPQRTAVATTPPAGATPSPIPTASLTPGPTLVAAPLTGLPVTEAAALRWPIAVMIDDHLAARPQSGFNAASIVWQAPAEGGIPRYMLIFQDTIPGSVGPVRSAREYFIEWAAEWRATYVHVGGSPQALTTLRLKGQGQLVWNADEFRYEGSYLWRITERYAPHNVYSDGAHLRALAAHVGADDGPIKPVWRFGPDRAMEVRPDSGTIKVIYPYESITYRYDPLTNSYHRFINGSKVAQVDAADGRVVAPKNVVILRMRFGPLNDGHPLKYRLEAENIGSGTAYIATNGVTVKGTWRKASIGAPTLLFGPNGKPIRLTAGQTFVQVIALSYGFSIHDGAAAAPVSQVTSGGLTEQ